MTEYSMFWDGCASGHALMAPYTAKMYRSFWDRMLIGDATKFAPVACTPSGAGLKVSIGGADQLDLSEGSAMIDGVYYWTDGVSWSLTRPVQDYYAYTVVLRKTQLAKTLNAQLLGPYPYVNLDYVRTYGFPQPTQNNLVWEVPIAYALADTDTGLLAVHDLLNKVTPNHSQLPALHYRQGNGNDWNAQGTTDYETDEAVKVQVGAIEWTGVASTSGNKSITFPEAWTHVPAVFAQVHNAKITTSVQQNTTTATIYWRCMDATTYTSVTLYWIAIGKKDQL